MTTQILTANTRMCLSRRQACEQLAVGLSTLKDLLGRGELREIRIGRKSVIPLSEIERFLTERLAPSEASA